MRPGLVAVGALFLGLAVAGAAVLVAGPGAAPDSTSRVVTTWTAGPHGSNASVLAGPSGADRFTVAWNATVPIDVAIYAAGGCAPGATGCPDWSLAAQYNVTLAGAFSPPAVAFPYRLVWTNPGAVAGVVVVTTTAAYPTAASFAPAELLALGAGDAALGVVGGAALFLGLFLRAGVYGGRPPPAPRGPDERPPPGH